MGLWMNKSDLDQDVKPGHQNTRTKTFLWHVCKKVAIQCFHLRFHWPYFQCLNQISQTFQRRKETLTCCSCLDKKRLVSKNSYMDVLASCRGDLAWILWKQDQCRTGSSKILWTGGDAKNFILKTLVANTEGLFLLLQEVKICSFTQFFLKVIRMKAVVDITDLLKYWAGRAA